MNLLEAIRQREGQGFPAACYAAAVLAPNYHQAQAELLAPLLAAHQAHLVMLCEKGLIDATAAGQIALALDRLDLKALATEPYSGVYEDLFFQVEAWLLESTGEIAGNLHLGRSRNDLGVALFRLALRQRLLAALEAATELYAVLIELAEVEAETVMIAHTHTQPAQPTTLGHWLLAAADGLGRDLARLQEAYSVVNRSPLGAAAITGSGFALDRLRLAELLGFEGPIENTYDAIAGADYLSSTATAAQLTALHLGRVVQDLLFWSTQEVGRLRLADAYVQCSSIMPQKRNPVALEHVRLQLSAVVGGSATVLQMLHNTPFGDINDSEDGLQPHLWRAVDGLGSACRLLSGILASAQVNRATMLVEAEASFANLTELADHLVRQRGLTFRQAHSVVAELVRQAGKEGVGDVRGLAPSHLDGVAVSLLGHPVGLSADELAQVLQPAHFVAVRQGLGGAAPAEVKRMVLGRRQVGAAQGAWLQRMRGYLGRAAEGLAAAWAALR